MEQDKEQSLEKKIRFLRRHEEEQRTEEFARRTKHPYKDIIDTPVESEAVLTIPEETARTAGAVAIRRDDQRVTLATTDPEATGLAEVLAFLKKQQLETEIVVVSKSGLEYALNHYQRYAHLAKRITGEVRISHERIDEIRKTVKHIAELKEMFKGIAPADAASLVEVLLGGAMKLEASDIHIEPEAQQARVRYRLDGVLYDVGILPQRANTLLLSRIKLLSALKLNITDMGQDGRFTIYEDGAEIEIRTSTLPGERGEYVVMRLLNPKSLLSLSDLGMRSDLIEIIQRELKEPNGMILTTGPTGSGKTTALYAFLQAIANSEIKIITIEDPIEYRLQGIEQTQVEPEAGYDFANGLRSIVRQDPDVVLVGEIRDLETAEIALHASLTGHLVFSTLHTNDAAGAIPRLIDFKVNPTVIAPALNIVIAQRLLRRLCRRCVVSSEPTPEEKAKITEALKAFPEQFSPKPSLPSDFKLYRQGKGCEDCHFTGYRGRIGIFELFRVDSGIEELILTSPSMEGLTRAAREQGMIPLQLDGLLRIIDGVTTLDELERLTGPFE